MRLQTAKVMDALPSARFRPEGGEEALRRMQGATVIRVGALDEGELDGGGFVIDYRPKGSMQIWRLVLAFHEDGMWVEYDGALPTVVAAQE